MFLSIAVGAGVSNMRERSSVPSNIRAFKALSALWADFLPVNMSQRILGLEIIFRTIFSIPKLAVCNVPEIAAHFSTPILTRASVSSGIFS